MSENRWEVAPLTNPTKIKEIKEALNVPEIVANLLVNRGIDSFEKAKTYFRPQLSTLHDPFLMEDMAIAVDRINEALANNEKILVYGDYDVDGTTSVALVYSYLKKLTPHIDHYQPDRYTEGYGVSFQGVEYAKENNFSLIIALDCGTKAVDKIAKANEYGIDFIIGDHHTAGEELPKAKAILNPKKTTCNYPYKELCGCGIGFKLIEALAIKNNYNIEDVYSLLDLVAIAIGADIVPITGENRVLAYYGLKQIAKTPRLGIKTMLELANKKGEITISDLVFTVAPRINAAGRIDSARNAVELLLSENKEDANSWGDIVNKYNSERKEIDKDITTEALRLIKEDASFSDKKSTVISNAQWHKGVVGIVASRIIENYYKPTIVLVEADGMASGSARSVKGFDVYEAINECAHLLDRFGGHKYAAGLSLKLENLEQFKTEFETAVKKKITAEQEIRILRIDGELIEADFSQDSAESTFPKFYRLQKQMAPFGPQNMTPVFILKNLVDA
jgi:single-stranded-DNA-specific exonuclease